MHSSHQPPTAIARLQRAGRLCLQRFAALLKTGATARSETFRRMQHRKWLGTKATAPAARPRRSDLYRRPLVDLGERTTNQPQATATRSSNPPRQAHP